MSWRPDGLAWNYRSTRSLNVGEILAWDHAVWRVLTISRRDPVDVVDQREYVVVLRPIGSTDTATASTEDLHLSAASYASWYYAPDDHYPVCNTCHEPLPCREKTIQAEVDRSIDRLSRYEIAGVCPACQEPVTTRHTRQTWPENLVAMNGEPVTFHLRKKCIDEADRYDREWMRAGHPSQLGHQSEQVNS